MAVIEQTATNEPVIITLLNAVGGIFVFLGCAGLLGAVATEVSTVGGAGLIAWGEVIGLLVFGFLVLGLAAIVRQLHRVNVALAAAATARPLASVARSSAT